MDIYEFEEEVIGETQCEDGKYYLSAVMKVQNELVLDYRVDPRIFFQYSYTDVLEYAKTSNSEPYVSDDLHIVQVVFKDELYTAVIKTYWLKVVQKTWKRFLHSKKTWLANVKKNILSYLKTGRIPAEPTWKGFIYQM